MIGDTIIAHIRHGQRAERERIERELRELDYDYRHGLLCRAEIAYAERLRMRLDRLDFTEGE